MILVSSCSNYQPKTKKLTAYKEQISETQKLKDNSFKSFIKEFNKNCDFQKESVKFPLQVISLLDWENEVYDTSYTESSKYECIKLTAPKSNIVDGQITLKYDYKPTETIVTLGVEDTGIHIQYFFELTNDKWRLIKMVDEST